MEISKMAQNTQDGNVSSTPDDAGLQLQIPGLEQLKYLKFVQSEANPADLIIQFPDGSETVIPNYIPLAQAGAPPALTLEDGTVIPGAEIVSLIDNLDYDKIATAAGDPGAGGQTATGGGAAFLADPSGPLGDNIGHGPYAGGIKIADAVGFEQLPSKNGPDESESGLTFDAVDDYVIHNYMHLFPWIPFLHQGRGEQISQVDGPATIDIDVDDIFALFDINSNPFHIPDAALRHNDIYPRGDWDLVSVQNPGPDADPEKPAADFEDEGLFNILPSDTIRGDTFFDGSNSTARFTKTVEDAVFGGDPLFVFDAEIGEVISYRSMTPTGGESWVAADGSTSNGSDVLRFDWDTAVFCIETESDDPGQFESEWDGIGVYLYEGETITIAGFGYSGDSHINPGQYYIAFDHDGDSTTGGTPFAVHTPGNGPDIGWTDWKLVDEGLETLSYTAETDGMVYVGTGFGGYDGWVGNPDDGYSLVQSPEGVYHTLITIDGQPYGEFDYTATDFVESDSAHVTVDARNANLTELLRYFGGEDDVLDRFDSPAPGEFGETLTGHDVGDPNNPSGDDILISGGPYFSPHGPYFDWDPWYLVNDDTLEGLSGDDVLIGRGGNDHLHGGAGRDLFLFESANDESPYGSVGDGHDTIYDFSIDENDIINLDILFDNLGIADGRAAREPLIVANPTDADGGAGTTDTLLTINHGGAADFSITILNNDFSGVGEIASLIDNGNLVVDES